MESQTASHGTVIEIRRDGASPSGVSRFAKTCGEAACGLAGDAKERSSSARKLSLAAALCLVFMGVEIYGGIRANSLAILTDAAHLLSDVAAFAISLFSLWASSWEANPRQSYGFFRVEILGALISIQLIWVLAGILVYEAIVRLVHESAEVDGFLMFLIATFGLAVNVLMAFLLGHDHGHGHSHGGHDHHTHGVRDHGHDKHDHGEHDHHGHDEPLLEKHIGERRRNINVQGAYLHVLGDSIQSVGVMIGGAIIWWKPQWKIVDLICTLVFSVVVLGTTVRMLRNILEVLMESTPREVDATELERGLLAMDEVVAVHELHIWAITVGKVLLACHVKIGAEANADSILERVVDYIRREYNISHVTIQIER